MSLKDIKSRFELGKLTYSTKFWVLFIISLIVILIFYYVLLDTGAPLTRTTLIYRPMCFRSPLRWTGR